MLYEFWQRKENQQHQNLLKKPEEALLAALASDFTKHGVILVDTLEQASKQNLQTRLAFCDDGGLETPVAENPHALSLLDYCAGMAHFLFDKPVVMVMAGRPPAIRELGALPVEYFAPTVEVPAFTAAEIRTYLEKSLPRHIASPQDSDISKLQQLTLGNPFLLERVVRLLADWQPLWEWQAQQWQPLLNSFQQDERHGLLLYVTQRLLTHVLPDDRAFWRLALPRQFIHRDMAELLFPKAEFGEQSGLQRLKTYEEKGTVYREQDPDRYFLHDETRAAFSAWARRENVWLDKAACETHAQLAAWFDQQSGWPDQYQDPTAKTPENGNPLLLEGAYHTFMADPSFAIREQGQDKEEFWKMLAGSLYRANAWKRQRVDLLPTEEPHKTSALLQADWEFCSKRFQSHTAQYLTQKASRGDLPADWQGNESTIRELLKTMPDDPEVWGLLAELESLTGEEREQHYRKAIELAPNNADRLGDFAVFMELTRKDYDHAEAFYQKAINADPTDAHWLGNFAYFVEKIRKDYDRAEALYGQAVAADPTHARNLGNFALFMKNIRKDYDRAEKLYEQAIAADPNHANNLGNFAVFMETIRKDYDRAEVLYEQVVAADPNHARNLGNFADFVEKIRKDYDRAELLYEQSIAADPKDARNLGWFAYFMHYIRKDYDRAETLYEQSIAADPNHARNLGNFALFMKNIRKDYDRAEKLYARVIAADPKYAHGLGNFAVFMKNIRKDYDRAESLYAQAIAADPRDAHWLGNFAVFMESIRKDYDRTELLYEQAIAADPNHANNLGNFAVFMETLRKDYDRAEVLYEQSLAADPTYAHNLGDFAVFMQTLRKDYDRAELLYAQSLAADPTHAHNLGNFAAFMETLRKDYDRAELLYAQAITADPTNARNLGNFADFVEKIRKDYDRAELLYAQAVAADPTDARNLGNFAVFMQTIRKDYLQAKQLYHRALAIEPNETNIMANLAQLYLLEGDKTQGKALIEQAFALNPEDIALKLELWFYRFAHFPEDYPQAQIEIRALLETGERSEGWDFSVNIAQAEKDGHPNVALLQALADVISGKAELDSLDQIR